MKATAGYIYGFISPFCLCEMHSSQMDESISNLAIAINFNIEMLFILQKANIRLTKRGRGSDQMYRQIFFAEILYIPSRICTFISTN